MKKMMLGEIKIEALKLMFASYERDFSVSDLDVLSANENYRDYLINMPGAINRAFAVIENSGVLPCKAKVFTENRLDLSLFDDIFRVERVEFDGMHGRIPSYPYRLSGKLLILDELGEGESYVLIYRPRIPRETSNTAVLDVPNELAAYIPYFIKGELYREEEPDEATVAHDLFMNALDLVSEKSCAGRVETVFFY